jgi:cytidyltransferase-like protein
MNIYIDGIFDLYHAGHVETLKLIKDKWSNCKLIVGVINDSDAESYKRLPVINEKNRYFMIESCKYVDKLIRDAPLFVDMEFIKDNNIDLIVHSFSDIKDKDNQEKMFKKIIEANKFEEITYSLRESTTNIIKRIKENY